MQFGDLKTTRGWRRCGGAAKRAIAAALLAATILAPGIATALRSSTEWIYFLAISGPNSFIRDFWRIHPDGSGLEQITVNDFVHSPAISPDGSKLAFTRVEVPFFDCGSLYIRDLTTGEETLITPDDQGPGGNPLGFVYGSLQASWSPDGTKLAFHRWIPNSACDGAVPGTARLWVVDVSDLSGAGPGTPQIIPNQGGGEHREPSWSPDGTELVYQQFVGTHPGPWTIRKISYPGGFEEEVIPWSSGGNFHPNYSPVGSKIAYSTPAFGSAGTIAVADMSDPAGTRKAVPNTVNFTQPNWSPDGQQLTIRMENGSGLYTINEDGSDKYCVLCNWDKIISESVWGVASGLVTPDEQLEANLEDLESILDANPGSEVADEVEGASVLVDTALDELAKIPADGQAAIGAIEGAVGDLEAALGMDPELDAEIEILLDGLVAAARGLAQTAVDVAIEELGDPVVIAEAQQSLGEGDILRDSGAAKDAVNKYKDAQAKAESA